MKRLLTEVAAVFFTIAIYSVFRSPSLIAWYSLSYYLKQELLPIVRRTAYYFYPLHICH